MEEELRQLMKKVGEDSFMRGVEQSIQYQKAHLIHLRTMGVISFAQFDFFVDDLIEMQIELLRNYYIKNNQDD